MSETGIRRVRVGDVVRVALPGSGVCHRLWVADHVRAIRVREQTAQILNDDGSDFSTPIAHGEAGVCADADGLYVHRVPQRLYRVYRHQRPVSPRMRNEVACMGWMTRHYPASWEYATRYDGYEIRWEEVMPGEREAVAEHVNVWWPDKQVIIPDGVARTIAAWHQEPRVPGLAGLATSGAIHVATLSDEISDAVSRLMREQDEDEEFQRVALAALLAYVIHHGDRGPVPGWAHLWANTNLHANRQALPAPTGQGEGTEGGS